MNKLTNWEVVLRAKSFQELQECNTLTQNFNLNLSPEQIQEALESRFKALQDTGRIEFGEGILKKLILAFCDSPYLNQENYLPTILELQEAFYYFKNESLEQILDDELLEYMKLVFDGRAQGSVEYLAGTSLEELSRYARQNYDPFNPQQSGDLF